MDVDHDWLRLAVDAHSPDQLIIESQVLVEHPVARIEALFEAWALGLLLTSSTMAMPTNTGRIDSLTGAPIPIDFLAGR